MNQQASEPAASEIQNALIEQLLAHYNASEFDKARDCSDELLALLPQDYAALHLAGVIATAQKRLPEASEFLKQALNCAPDSRKAAASWCGLGQALFAAGDLRQAEEAFRRAHRMEPGAGYDIELAMTYAAEWKLDQAIDILRLAIQQHPADATPCVALGTILTQAGRQVDALMPFQLALQRQPDSVPAHHNLGNTLKMLGRYQEAETEIRKALLGNPAAELYSQLAQLKKFTADDAELELIKARLRPESHAIIGARIDAGFALAKIYDDLGDYRTAFKYLDDANQLKRSTVDYSAPKEEMMVDGIIKLYSRDFLMRFAGKSASQLAPIFIVGMPRSGTTLTEQILASHSQVQGGGELPYLIKLVSEMGDVWGSRGDAAPGDDATVAQDLAQTAERYAGLTAYFWQKRARFTDKLPMNFLAIGPIHLLFPNATIIYCKRQPMATCFSCYQYHFAHRNLLYSYNMAELGHMYRLHERIMEH
ncbi:MAG: sulfotransferase, partial [Gammaproteobacteria bacterium]